MSQVSVSIDGKMFRMACEDGQEAHLEALAKHLDVRIGEMRQAFGEIGDLRLTVMAAITITDEFTEARKKAEDLTQQIGHLRNAQVSAQDNAGARDQEIAGLIDRMTQRLERIAGLLSQRPEM
ncbi:MAG TPA: cell division protein ZapA [Beijerinckiaceae bacterium]|nr:cell division protein ZapA [Beijerinckiaceae bacterium]